MKSFETCTFGKWILAGEHSVLRGSPALVFPLKSRILKFLFRPDPLARELKLKSDGPIGKELELLFWGVFKKALEMKNQSNDPFKGEVFIQSEIPLGAGLGASASLCVATTRWFQSMGLVSESEKHEFARELENMFHGESSGVDIAVVTEEIGLRFLKQGPRSLLAPSWKPRLFISYCGQKGVTYQCVSQVKTFISKYPARGDALDGLMSEAVHWCEQGLTCDPTDGYMLLKKGIQLANQCFTEWGLCQGLVGEHMDWLEKNGASAIKPTGSGGGGYVLSLWKNDPPVHLLKELIPCF